MNAEEISLGFMEIERRTPRWFFPSKVGGLPLWHSGPPPSNLFCSVCTPEVPLTLLVQIYAPVEDTPSSFHRTVYVFCCLSCGVHFRAISCCLPRNNAEYPNCAVSTFFESKEAFWRMWRQQQQQTQQKTMGGLAGTSKRSSAGEPADQQSIASSSISNSTEASPSVKTPQQQQEDPNKQLQQQANEDTKLAVIRQLQRGERLRQVCCCPVCGLGGGETVGETERAAAVCYLQQVLQRSERRLQVLLMQQSAAAADNYEDAEPQAVVDLDLGGFETENTEADQKGLLLLDAEHIQTSRVLHPRCLKRLKFGSVYVSFPEFPLSIETEDYTAKSSAKKSLDAALERLDLEGHANELTHEEQLLRRYQQMIRESPVNTGMSAAEADLDESEADAFEEIHQKYTSQDPQLEAFLKRCGAPEVKGHVVRYALGGKPLWPFSGNQLEEKDIPSCICGAKRQFEFQVQPQLVSQLVESVGSSDPAATASLERLSFGILAVFTCSACCISESPCKGYREEFVYAQPDPFYG